MKYLGIAVVLVILISIFKSCNFGLTQEACMTEGRLAYKGSCVTFDSIPYEDRNKVVQKVADEKGISFDEAYELVR